MSDPGAVPAANLPAPAAIPRLSILHLLLWTGFTAACITCASMNVAYVIIPQPQSSIIKVLALPLAMLDGAAITALVVLLPIAFFNHRSLQPGHWILLAWGLAAIVSNLTEFGLGAAMRWEDGINSAGHLNRAFAALKIGVGLPFVLTPIFRLRGQRAWVVYFSLRTVAAAIALVVSFLGVAIFLLKSDFAFWVIFISSNSVFLGELAAFITLIVAGILDHRTGRQGDWLHYTGLVMVLLFPLATVVLNIGAQIVVNLR